MSHDIFDNDCELVESLGKRIGLKRLEDVLPEEDYVLHASYWWMVTGEVGETGALELEIAGPSDPMHPEAAILAEDDGSLVVTASAASAGLQFQDGVLLDVPWPCCGLIYVKRASKRGAGNDPDEKVFGIFSLRYDSDGSPYYAPVDPEMQRGVASNWFLYSERDLILSWEPVDVADLLREYSGVRVRRSSPLRPPEARPGQAHRLQRRRSPPHGARHWQDRGHAGLLLPARAGLAPPRGPRPRDRTPRRR